jgi:hypothetical protein
MFKKILLATVSVAGLFGAADAQVTGGNDAAVGTGPQAVANASACKAILPHLVVTIIPGFVNVDGTLLLNGQSQCTVVNIECQKDIGEELVASGEAKIDINFGRPASTCQDY